MRWGGWKRLISEGQKQGLACGEQSWWCSGVPTLCRRNCLGLCGNCHEPRPWDELNYELAGRLMRHHSLGLVHAQPHKHILCLGSKVLSHLLSLWRGKEGPDPQGLRSQSGGTWRPHATPQMMNSACSCPQQTWGCPSLIQAAPLASEQCSGGL